MTNERWTHLMEDETLRLTQDELNEGWHFCPDWDGLLINTHSHEGKFCTCLTRF